jgi:hypothetical protein
MKGTVLQAADKPMFCVRARLYILRENTGFEGYELQLVHDCLQTDQALAAEGLLLLASATFSGTCLVGF